MDLQTAGVILLSVVFASYTMWIATSYEILYSISESYYRLQKDKLSLLFYLFCLLLGLGIWPQILIENNDPASASFFFSMAGIIFTGTAAAFKKELTAKVHYAGAGIAITGALVGIWFAYGNWIPLALLLPLGGIAYLTTKNKIWWFEVVAFTLIIIGLIIK